MTVLERIERARNDIIKVRETVSNSRANLTVLNPLMRAERELSDVVMEMDKEQTEIVC